MSYEKLMRREFSNQTYREGRLKQDRKRAVIEFAGDVFYFLAFVGCAVSIYFNFKIFMS